jgi:hypothetical protein
LFRSRRRSASGDERADVGFMLAMHHALRRDMGDVQAQIDLLADGKSRGRDDRALGRASTTPRAPPHRRGR